MDSSECAQALSVRGRATDVAVVLGRVGQRHKSHCCQPRLDRASYGGREQRRGCCFRDAGSWTGSPSWTGEEDSHLAIRHVCNN
eukprot:symbB.v1.2.029124.t1/scaffold3089.1/size63894/4